MMRALLAGLLGAGCLFATPASAAPAKDRPVRAASVRQTVAPGRTLALYLVVPPRGHGRHPAVLVLPASGHPDRDSRTLADHLALLGYVACVPDLLSRSGGPPAAGAAMATLDPAEALADAIATAGWLGHNPAGEQVLTGQVAAIGVAAGGALALRLAAHTPLAAAIVFDDPAAAPPAALQTPLLRPSGAPSDPAAWAAVAAFLKEHLR